MKRAGRAVVIGVRKTFQRKHGALVPAVDNISLSIGAGEFVVLLGPSGCGKTTLLRCIAGIEAPDEGTITLQQRTVFSSAAGIDLPPESRGLSMMFQSYALWPHMTALANVRFPLTTRGCRGTEARRRANEALALVGIADLAAQHPAQMSGGQQQRVALARALVANDPLVLFDEPLSNVDAMVRGHLRTEIARVQKEIGFSSIYVTHDREEALTLAHRVVVMRGGRIAQSGSPQEIYERPTSRYVANFLGAMNEIPARVVGAADGMVRLETPLGAITAAGAALAPGTPAVLAVRPERCRLATEAPADGIGWEAELRGSTFHGDHWLHSVRARGIALDAWGHAPPPGTRIWLCPEPTALIGLEAT